MGKRGQSLKTCCNVFQTSSKVGARSRRLSRKSGHAETAVLALARAAESSAHPMDSARLGAALQAINRPREAIVAFRRALEAAPDLVEARAALGACLRQTGELRLARVELERAVTLRPSDGRAWFALGLVCEDLRDTPGAIQAYRGAIEAQPDTSRSARQPGPQSAKRRRSRRRDGFLSTRDAPPARYVQPHRPGADVSKERPPLAQLSATASLA